MQTILTKFLPATDFLGARLKAVQSGWNDKTECKSVTISYPHELSSEEAHAFAARKLAEKLGWSGRYVVGSLGAWSDYCNVYVMVEKSDRYDF